MSAETIWRLIDISGERTPEGLDLVALGLQANGREYAVTVCVAGPMSQAQCAEALRAALAHWLSRCGANVAENVPGARVATDADMRDTTVPLNG